MTPHEEREALAQLIRSDGWRVFWAYVDAEWGAGGRRFESTLTSFADATQDDARTVQQIRQIAVARREILRLHEWPQSRIRQLSEPASATSPRPPLPSALAGQSRGGG